MPYSFHHLILLAFYYYAKQNMKGDEAKQRRKKDDDQIIRLFLCFPASAADAAAANPKWIKTLLANSLITFFRRSNPVVFDKLIGVDKLFTKALQIFAACLLVNNNSCGKLILSSESPIIFHDNLKTFSVPSSIANLNLSSYEFGSFTFKLLYCVILYW